MKPYIDTNTKRRVEAKNEFEKEFYKLMINSVYGKTIENVRNHFDVKLTIMGNNKFANKEQKYLNSSSLAHAPQIFHNVATWKLNKKEIILDKPIIVGCTILDISKVLIYDFHYGYMKQKYGDKCQLLMTDTDSLVYKITTESWIDDVKEDANDFYDFSNYPINHPLFSKTNSKKLRMMKDESAGIELYEFIGLKAKMYSMLFADGHEKHTSKGISKSAVVSQHDLFIPYDILIRHEHYKKCLEDEEEIPISMYGIRAYHHVLNTIKMSKNGLSADDNKRYLLKDNYTSLSYGHYKLKNF